ncbi:MAG: hypothetical protein ACJ71J_03440 [Nitrososphaeraceae archaeon]
MSKKIKANEIQWRRSKVIEMRARGMSQIEIARELQVSEASISLDMQYLRIQAKESIRDTSQNTCQNNTRHVFQR